MGKNSLKHKRMKGGDGGGLFESLFTTKIFGITLFTILSIFLIPGVFIGTWAGFGFDTSYEIISYPLLATALLFNVFILPLMYGYKVSKFNTLHIGHSWMPDRGITWQGFFGMLVIWITAGLLAAILFGGTSKYDTGIIRGLATAGICVAGIGVLDIFVNFGYILVKYLRNPAKSSYKPYTPPEYGPQLPVGDDLERETLVNDSYDDTKEPDDDKYHDNMFDKLQPDDSNHSLSNLSSIENIPYNEELDNEGEQSVGGRIHKRRRSRSNSRGRRRHK